MPQGRKVQRRSDHRGQKPARQPYLPTCIHGRTPGAAGAIIGTTYVGLNAVTARAIASATPGIMRSRVARSATETLELSTAIAGAAVVRNCRTGATCASVGEPLNRRANSACTKSPNLRLKLVNGA